MDNFPSLREYLKINSADHLSKSDITNLRKQYRLLYFKEYNKRRKKNITLTLRLKINEYNKIVKFKEELKYPSLNKCIVETLLAYINQKYVFPQEESKQKLVNEINAIGTNVNQVVHKLHIHSLRVNGTKGTLDTSEQNLERILAGYTLLKELVDELKEKIISYIQTPQTPLFGTSWNEIQDDPQKLDILITQLEKYRDSN